MLKRKELEALSATDQQAAIFREIIKCKVDPIYCIENYISIPDAETGEEIFLKLYDYQANAIEGYEDYNYNLSMKSRQMGFSTITAAYCAWDGVTKNNRVINVLANKMLVSKKNLRMIRNMIDSMRKNTLYKDASGKEKSWLVCDYMDDMNGKEQFGLKTGSVYTAEANNDAAGRGGAISVYWIDEIAAIDKSSATRMEEIWASAGLTLAKTKGKCIGISCVTKDTFVFTPKGIKQVGEFIDAKKDETKQQTFSFLNSYQVLGHSKFRKGNLFHYNGVTDIYKLTTTFSELKGSSEHKLWCYNYNTKVLGWKKLKEITTNDWVNNQYNQQVWGNNDDVSDFKPLEGKNYRNFFSPKKLTPDICYLLGLYIAEGSAYKVIRGNKAVGGALTISCGDDITKVFRDLGLKHKTTGIGTRINSWCLVQFLEYLGFDISVKAPGKKIPERLFSCSKENLVALLQGMFDGDGSSSSTNGTVTYSSSSEELINQVRILLQNFGSLSCKYLTTQENLNKNLPEGWYKFTCDAFALQTYGKNALNYYNEIGFRLERKQLNKEKLKKDSVKQSLLPNSKEVVNNLYKLSNTSPWKLATYEKTYIPKNTSHSCEKVKRLLEIIIEKNPELVNHSYIKEIKSKLLIENSTWAQVKNIEVLKVQEPVFDFSLPENDDFWCHSVLYNGILGHQTPIGMAGWYFDTYTNAEEKGWNIIKAHWSEHPDYSKGSYQWIVDETLPGGGYLKHFNLNWPEGTDKFTKEQYKTKDTYSYIKDGKLRSPWYDIQSKKLGIQKTLCELDCSFAGSGGEVLSSEIIKEHEIKASKAKRINEEGKGPWKYYKKYKEYVEDHEYVLTSDVMTGDGADYSSILVIDITAKELVATWKAQFDPIMLAEMIYKIAQQYKQPIAIVEYQGPGLTTLLELKNRWLYKNLFFTTLKKNDITKTAKRKIGFWQSSDTRRLGGDKLEEILNNSEKLGWDLSKPDILLELYTWIWDKDGKRRHAPGKHDDALMALANALYYIFYVKDKQGAGRAALQGGASRESTVWGINTDARYQGDVDDLFDDL